MPRLRRFVALLPIALWLVSMGCPRPPTQNEDELVILTQPDGASHPNVPDQTAPHDTNPPIDSAIHDTNPADQTSPDTTHLDSATPDTSVQDNNTSPDTPATPDQTPPHDTNPTELTSPDIPATPDLSQPDTRPQGKGTLVGSMYITYYYLAREADYTGTADTTLYDSNCKAITQVSSKFSDSVCIEGSGILNDGRVINYAKSCSCGRTCPTGGIICYSVLDKTKYPWGAGAASRALRPLRSLAVDRTVIPIGTPLYIQEWDGVQLPSVDGIGGFVHDGCVTADDVGGAIKGMHFDFFSGTRSMWLALEKIHKTKTYLTVYKNPARCP